MIIETPPTFWDWAKICEMTHFMTMREKSHFLYEVGSQCGMRPVRGSKEAYQYMVKGILDLAIPQSKRK